MNEVFGENNFLGCAARVSKKANNQGDYWSPNFDYLVTYARNRDACPGFTGGANEKAYDQIEASGPRKGERYQLLRLYMTSLDPMRGCTNQRYWIQCPDGSLVIPPGDNFPSERSDGVSIAPKSGNDKVWRWTRKKYEQEKHALVIREVRSSNLVDENGNPAKWNVFTKAYLRDVLERASAKPNSLIEEHINQLSSHELGRLDIPFAFAKPSSLIRYLCEISRLEEDDIVLDFFAGSGSTAHAVLDWNQQKSDSAKFVLVQLPEPCNEDTDEFKAGYKTISEITKERARRVIKKLNDADDSKLDLGNAKEQDRGFRVFKLAESNFKTWQADAPKNAEALTTQLELHVDHIRDDRTPDDLLYEILLKSGFPLTTKVEKLELGGKPVHSIADGALLICLDRALTLEAIRAMAARKPERVVCLDEGFAGNDQLKANAVQIFKTQGVASFKTV
jgi:adenine-specific DNA-methyltransferase